MPVEIRWVPTWLLTPTRATQVRALLDAAFAGSVEETDWEHALGGLHALAFTDPVGGRGRPDGDRGDRDQTDGDTRLVIGHAALVLRRLLYHGRALRCGYVEAVAVAPGWQRRGVGTALMAKIETAIRGGYEVGALGTTEQGRRLYLARGWQAWRGPTATLTPTGIQPTPHQDGAVLVWPGPVELDLDAPLTSDWRAGDPW